MSEARLRQIDRAVAEKVMGWTVYHYSKGRLGYFMLLDANGNNVHLIENPVGWATEELMWAHCPRFSESWDAAGQVVEKMRELGWGIIVGSHEATEFVWWSTFVKGGIEHEAQANTFPLSVALAALKVFGVEVPG